MEKNVKKKSKKKKINWRIDVENFKEQGRSRQLPPGTETYSAGWFAQGHHVSFGIRLKVCC
jgi:hypothetical protein